MKMLWPLAALIAVALALFAPRMSTADSAMPLISTNEGGCWDKCKTCESKCKGNNACKDKCWTQNDSCCNGAGGKGVYKMCGCTDK